MGGGDLLPSDIIAGDVVIFTYDGVRWWINPNPIINQNVTLNAANNGEIDAIFNALARKRIQPDKTVTIKLAQAIFGPFKTFHIDSDRIIVAGTMKAARPTVADFAKTGSSAGQRAADSANNIAMLRSRYGTEIRFQNTDFGGVIQHVSPGRITFQDLLLAGPNTFAGADYVKIAGINPPRGGGIYCLGVAIWGSGSMGFMCVSPCSIAHNASRAAIGRTVSSPSLTARWCSITADRLATTGPGSRPRSSRKSICTQLVNR